MPSENVIDELSRYGIHRIRDTSVPLIVMLSMTGGAFIIMGALFSVLLSEQVQALDPRYLLQWLRQRAALPPSAPRPQPNVHLLARLCPSLSPGQEAA